MARWHPTALGLSSTYRLCLPSVYSRADGGAFTFGSSVHLIDDPMHLPPWQAVEKHLWSVEKTRVGIFTDAAVAGAYFHKLDS